MITVRNVRLPASAERFGEAWRRALRARSCPDRAMRLLVCTLLVCHVATPALGQTDDFTRDPGLVGDPGQRLRDVGAVAGRIGDAKAAFVTALRNFVEALPGAYGDEGPSIRQAVADLQTALAQWDDGIRSFRSVSHALDGNADVHVALGTAYLDYGLTTDAVEQFQRALDAAPRRGDASLLLALAYEEQGKRPESTRALATAVRVAPDNPAIGYASVQHAVAGGDEGEISRTLLAFLDRRERSGPPASPGATAMPFVRLGLLREAAGVAPVFAPALYATGVQLLATRRYREAVMAFQRAVEQDPLAAADDTFDERLRAAAELRAGHPAAAIARLERAVATWPDSSELRRLLAAAYAGDDRLVPAVEQLTAAIARRSRDERSRLALADLLIAAGSRDGAERALLDARDAMPASAQVLYRLARLHQSQSHVPEALAAFVASGDLAIVIGRDSLYETIAALRVSEGEFTSAITAYRLELEVNPNNPAAHRRVGDLYAQEGRLGESLAEYAAALMIDPRDADAHASRAQTLLRMSRFADAAAAARTAVMLRPTHEPALYALGTALMRTGKTEEGLATLQEFERLQAMTRARNDAAWQLKLLKDQAAEHAARQDYATAADLLRRAVAYAPPDGSVHLAAGALLIKAGEYEEAIPLLKEALEREAVEAHRYLAEAYAALGRSDESRAHQAAYDAVRAARLQQGGARE